MKNTSDSSTKIKILITGLELNWFPQYLQLMMKYVIFH